MRKIAILFMVLIATLSLLAADFEVDGIAYNKLGGDSVEVTSKDPKYSDSITIPVSVTYGSTTYRVTSIGDDAFFACDSLTFITIPNGITHIGDAAFDGCSTLSSISIPNSVTKMGESVFSWCTSLSSITIPSSVTYIGERAFAWCTSLSTINVDATNKHFVSIDGVLFNYVKDSLIQYPAGNTRTNYFIPNSVTSIGSYAFFACDSLISITIPNSVTNIGGRAFEHCKTISFVTIPNKVTSIGEYAFYGCTSLTSITIPNSVTTIGFEAFSVCTSLSSVTCYATTPPTCGEICFYDVTKSIPLYVPANSIDAYKAADEWKEFTNIEAIAAEEVTEPVTTVITIPDNNSVTITWPTSTGADSYTIVIYKDGVPFCTLTFNAQGQLTNFAFAPSRGANNEVAATAVAGGYKFTITSLNPGTKYNYEIDTKNASGTSIANYTGSFTTEDPTTLNQLTDSPINRFTKISKDGQLLIIRDGKTYNAHGGVL